jgi:hypothetical protein
MLNSPGPSKRSVSDPGVYHAGPSLPVTIRSSPRSWPGTPPGGTIFDPVAGRLLRQLHIFMVLPAIRIPRYSRHQEISRNTVVFSAVTVRALGVPLACASRRRVDVRSDVIASRCVVDRSRRRLSRGKRRLRRLPRLGVGQDRVAHCPPHLQHVLDRRVSGVVAQHHERALSNPLDPG